MKAHFLELESFLSESQILKDQKSLEFYGQDWVRLYQVEPSLIVFPKTADEVMQLVKWARKNKIALVPSGGRTGLSGAAVASQSEVVVSFEKMNQLIEWNEAEETLTVEPGCITKEVQKWATDRGFYFPVSFAAEGSSQIGGNVATNAGGVRVIQYGSIRKWVRGLEVVTGRGEVLQLGRHLIKDSTGYNLLHLFIGSEGTLGFITKVTLAVTSQPKSLSVFLLGVSKLGDLIEIYSRFKKNIPLHAFEMMTDLALDYVQKTGRNVPLSTKSSYYVLMEIEESYQEEALSIFEKLMEEGRITDGTLSQSAEQAQEIWALRENISESIAPYKPYKNDIAVRISKLPEFLTQVDSLLKKEYPEYKVVWFGHIGDGNLHINILKPESIKEDKFVKNCERVNQLLFSKIQEFGGTISAEHGVGLLKKPYLHYAKSLEEINYMKEIKKIFDPDYIMNPGKIF